MLTRQTLNYQPWRNLGLLRRGEKMAAERELKIVSTAKRVGFFLL
jgi:hypothetical protein